MNDIQAIRIKLGLTQLQLAEYLGISRSSLNMYERYERTIPTPVLLKLAELQIQVSKIPGNPVETKGPEALPGNYKEKIEPALPNRMMQSKKDCQLNRLQRKLTEMKKQFQNLEQARTMLERLSKQRNTRDPDNTYWDMQLHYVLQKTRTCDPEAQDLLNKKIIALKLNAPIHKPRIK